MQLQHADTLVNGSYGPIETIWPDCGDAVNGKTEPKPSLDDVGLVGGVFGHFLRRMLLVRLSV